MLLRFGSSRALRQLNRIPAASRIALPAISVRCVASNRDLFTLDLDIDTHLKDTHNSQSEEAESRHSRDHDILNDIFADINFDDPKSQDSLLDLLLAEIPKMHEEKALDIDRTDEVPMASHQKGKPSGNVIEEEKELFQKIFDTYASKTATSGLLDNKVLWNLQDSFAALQAKPQAADLVHQPLLANLLTRLQDMTTKALRPVLDYMEEMKDPQELVEFLNANFADFIRNESSPDFYPLQKPGQLADDYIHEYDQVCEKIFMQSRLDPAKPLMNVHTMPAIFNHALELACSKFFDGQLAITFFNTVKRNLSLYTVVCNQMTYNELLKIYWIFFGQASLCEVELIVVEMINNGFSGDAQTYAVLKEILESYSSDELIPGGSEDEKRARNLTRKLDQIESNLTGRMDRRLQR